MKKKLAVLGAVVVLLALLPCFAAQAIDEEQRGFLNIAEMALSPVYPNYPGDQITGTVSLLAQEGLDPPEQTTLAITVTAGQTWNVVYPTGTVSAAFEFTFTAPLTPGCHTVEAKTSRLSDGLGDHVYRYFYVFETPEPVTPTVIMEGTQGSVTFSRNYTGTGEMVLWGRAGTPSEPIPWDENAPTARMIPPLGTTALWFIPWEAGLVTAFTPLGEGWYAIPKATITVAGNPGKLTFSRNYTGTAGEDYVIWGTESLPTEIIPWEENGTVANLIPPSGAHTFWFGSERANVVTSFHPLGDDWYEVPLYRVFLPSVER